MDGLKKNKGTMFQLGWHHVAAGSTDSVPAMLQNPIKGGCPIDVVNDVQGDAGTAGHVNNKLPKLGANLGTAWCPHKSTKSCKHKSSTIGW